MEPDLTCDNPSCESQDVRVVNERDLSTADGSAVRAYEYECSKCGWLSVANRLIELAADAHRLRPLQWADGRERGTLVATAYAAPS